MVGRGKLNCNCHCHTFHIWGKCESMNLEDLDLIPRKLYFSHHKAMTSAPRNYELFSLTEHPRNVNAA